MDRLPLVLPPPLLAGPFTRPMAAAVGVQRPELDRMLRAGAVRRLLRGVYVEATAADTTGLRTSALALVLPPGALVVDRTAGWVHGLHLDAAVPPPLETGLDVLGRARPARSRQLGAARPVPDRDVDVLGGVRVTTPVRTVLDLGRMLARDRALAVLDAALRRGWCPPAVLLAEVSRVAALPGGTRLRALAGLADGRARTAAASALRLRWLDAGLPTPVPGLVVAGAEITLAVPADRFGIVLGPVHGPVLGPALDAALDPGLAVPGWELVPVASRRVLHSDAGLVEDHLRREYHRHLLRRAG
jgi:hypothetical protein